MPSSSRNEVLHLDDLSGNGNSGMVESSIGCLESEDGGLCGRKTGQDGKAEDCGEMHFEVCRDEMGMRVRGSTASTSRISIGGIELFYAHRRSPNAFCHSRLR